MMKTATFVSLALAALTAHALPHAVKRADVEINDTVVLNFALTLEHLETAFYQSGLAKFDDAAFLRAGLPPFARGRFLELAADEKAHETLLTQVLGNQATQPCEYNFPFTDPKSFAALAQALEGVGVSAYAGAAKLISDKSLLTTAAVILSTEARHAAFVASAVNKVNPASGPFDVALGLNEVFTLAASFIKSCPPTNPPLPVKAFPALTVKTSSLRPGSTATVSFDASGSAPQDIFLAFLTGLDTLFAPIRNGKATLPALNGTVYAVVSTNGTAVSDETILAGPAILEFPFNSRGQLISN